MSRRIGYMILGCTIQRPGRIFSSLLPGFIVLLSILSLSCSGKEQVVIGFVADLSSRNAALGVEGRNGIQMAIDEINNNGGLNGKPVLLIIGDHKGDRHECFSIVSDFVEKSVDVIIGPMASTLAQTVIDAAEPGGILIIAPTVSSDELSGIDDMFLRIASSASYQGYFLAKAVMKRPERNIAVVMDAKNNSYAKGVLKGFLAELGNDISYSIDDFYFSGKDDYTATTSQLESFQPESIIFVASGIDTAGIIQQYAKSNTIPRLYGSSWVKVTKVTEYGGKTVEGMIIVDSYENQVPLDRELKFHEYYSERFSVPPNIASRSAYESIMMYAEAVRETESKDPVTIKTHLLNTKKIEGILDEFQLDEYGDGLRDLSYFIVENNGYTLMEMDD